MNIVKHPQFVAAVRRFREKRFEHFSQLMSRVPRPFSLIDIGGTVEFWSQTPLVNEPGVQITILNQEVYGQSRWPQVQLVAGDARNMPQFRDQQFDVVFSNSVIEHVGMFEQQRQMALEVMRIGKRYYVQTPNRNFIIEPHFVFPYFQYLPHEIQVWLVQHFRLGHVPRMPDRQLAERAVLATLLMSKRQLRQVFPNATIDAEVVMGMAKSYICHSGF